MLGLITLKQSIQCYFCSYSWYIAIVTYRNPPLFFQCKCLSSHDRIIVRNIDKLYFDKISHLTLRFDRMSNLSKWFTILPMIIVTIVPMKVSAGTDALSRMFLQTHLCDLEYQYGSSTVLHQCTYNV